ncbi:MAG: hypothetical protein E2O39_04255 [Planctomycetota bacterium]|nr:MAG: hypothetical protein E2O39_04255 [Planctomycetota bacterium]
MHHALTPLLLLVGLACGPPESERRPLHETWPDGGVKCVGTEIRLDGEWVKDGGVVFHREDGTQSAAGTYHLGLESGPWTEWLEDGSRAEGQYVEGLRSGPWTYWHANGAEQEAGAYEAGKRTGPWTWWYERGGKREESLYANGERWGLVTYWKPDGALDPERSGFFEAGVKVRN